MLWSARHMNAEPTSNVAEPHHVPGRDTTSGQGPRFQTWSAISLFRFDLVTSFLNSSVRLLGQIV